MTNLELMQHLERMRMTQSSSDKHIFSAEVWSNFPNRQLWHMKEDVPFDYIEQWAKENNLIIKQMTRRKNQMIEVETVEMQIFKYEDEITMCQDSKFQIFYNVSEGIVKACFKPSYEDFNESGKYKTCLLLTGDEDMYQMELEHPIYSWTIEQFREKIMKNVL